MKKKRSTCEVPDGFEIRGMRIRAYPTDEQTEALNVLMSEARHVWNTLCAQDDNARVARMAYAVREGLVPSPPSRPDYSGMDPDESKAAKRAYRDACFDRVREVAKAVPKTIEGYRRLSDQIEAAGFSYDYQWFQCLIRGKFGSCLSKAGVLQALGKTWQTFQKGQGRKQFRRGHDDMPVRSRTGACFELGAFGERRGKPFYDCQVTINGIKIRGRLPGKAPSGRILEGVSLRREADGWWASIREVVPVRVLTDATRSIVGVDVGLTTMVAMSDGTKVDGRGRDLTERVAGLQAMASAEPRGSEKWRALTNRSARLQAQERRRALHTIHSLVVPAVAPYAVIAVEKLPPWIGQGKDTKSSMRTVTAVIKQRFGSRVREVEPHFTSQECSQCGHRSKESWSYAHGRMGECPSCGHREHRDVNAARNIAAKCAASLVSC